MISREFPRSHGSRLVARPWHAEQIEHLALQFGNFKRYLIRVPHYLGDDQLEAEWQARAGNKPGK